MKSEIEVIILRDPNVSKDESRETLESNLEEVDKLSRLSRVLLQLSKLDQTDIVMEKIQLSAISEDVIKRYNQPSTRIKLIMTTKLPPVFANKDSIEELCMILVENVPLNTVRTTAS